MHAVDQQYHAESRQERASPENSDTAGRFAAGTDWILGDTDPVLPVDCMVLPPRLLDLHDHIGMSSEAPGRKARLPRTNPILNELG